MIPFNIRNQTIGGLKMSKITKHNRILMGLFITVFVAMFPVSTSGIAAHEHTTRPFTGVKVNGGTVTHTKVGDMKRMPIGQCQTGWSSSTRPTHLVKIQLTA